MASLVVAQLEEDMAVSWDEPVLLHIGDSHPLLDAAGSGDNQLTL